MGIYATICLLVKIQNTTAVIAFSYNLEKSNETVLLSYVPVFVSTSIYIGVQTPPPQK